MTLDDLQFKVLDKAKFTAIKSLQNFFKICGLDPNLFNHLYKIEFKIGNCKDSLAEFNPRKFKIRVDAFYLDDMIDELVYCETEKETNNVYLNIAVTLVHELLHANRTIMIEKGLNPKSIELIENNLDKEICNVEEINYYKSLLLGILDKPYVDLFNSFVPIKIRNEDNGLLTVVAYNKGTNNFEIFEKQKFNSVLDDNIDEFIKNIGIELNNKELHKSNKEIVDPNNIEEFYANSYVASDYYHKHTNIYTSDDVDDALATIPTQSDFEEVITETLASVIIMARNDTELDLEKINKKVQNGNSNIDEKLCMKIIYNEGLSIVKWFLTSVYEAEYYDKFEKIFDEFYVDLLMDFSDIYNSITNEEEVNSFSVEDVDSIITKKTGKSK